MRRGWSSIEQGFGDGLEATSAAWSPKGLEAGVPPSGLPSRSVLAVEGGARSK